MVKIFYLEDEPFLAKIVKETLESKGFHITLVSDGANAQNIFQADIYDICVLDIMVPNKNGYDIAEEIRAKNTDIPILFLTAKDQTADVLQGFKSGGNDYIRKPFSMEELIVRIENLIQLAKVKSNLRRKDVLNIGDIYKFKPQLHTLEYENKSISLSHRECQILQLMCSNIDQPTQRKQILLEVWGDDSFYNSRNLDVYISKLRRYFKNDPSIKIKTLKGVGYQFIIN